jgi:MFS family permease
MNARTTMRSIASYKMNPVIKLLILSDFIIWTSYQLIIPIFAIYVVTSLQGATIEVVGIATAVYLISKSIFEVPFGIYIDKKKGERDDLFFAIGGVFISALAYVLFAFVTNTMQLYGVQALLGFAAAMAYPGWYSLFTHHIDKGKEGFEWSLYDVLLGIGMAASAAAGGFFAERYGFDMLFFVVAGLVVLGGCVLLFARKYIFVS